MRYRSTYDKSCTEINGNSYLILRNEVIQVNLQINNIVHATVNDRDILLSKDDLEGFTPIPKRMSYEREEIK